LEFGGIARPVESMKYHTLVILDVLGLKVTKSGFVSALFLKLIFMEKCFVPSPVLMLCQISSPLNS
jgi:hypothetical protein